MLNPQCRRPEGGTPGQGGPRAADGLMAADTPSKQSRVRAQTVNQIAWARNRQRSKVGHGRLCREYFVFNLPLGTTAVVGGMGREDAAEESFGGLLSFFGFFAILLLRCSPLGMLAPDDELNVTQPKVRGCCLLEASFG
jgi:hypothetical protein